MQNYLTVSQLSQYLKSIFEAEIMLQNICVFGEISSYSISNGIAYFNIKDENSLLPCVLFNANNFTSPKIGDQVLVYGSMNYYIKGGKLSFNAYKIEQYGKGLLYEKFLELKNKLEKLGYFDIEHKKPLPERVKRIGVVTSSTGAVIQDIIDVTTRRNNSVDIVIYPVKVQGVGAEIEISKAIDFFSDYDKIDVVIVARGGGSLEDLSPFNTEIVATATYNCKKPIVSAVGHETDYTIIDFVSDLRAPTPSAAAELVVNKKSDDLDILKNIYLKMLKHIKNMMNTHYLTLEKSHKLLYNNLTNKINTTKSLLDKCKINIINSINNKVNHSNYQLDNLNTKLIEKDPLKLINKGYVKVYNNNNNVIKSIKDLNVNNELKIELIDGYALSQITELKGNK